jgi:hypothetical protein
MNCQMGRSLLSLVLIAGALTCEAVAEAPPANPAEVQAVETFEAQVKEYRVLHKKLESAIPKLPRHPTPEQIDKNQRALGDLIKSARKAAKPGDFFSAGVTAYIKRVLDVILSGPDGKVIRASIMDENPGVPSLKINERYPPSIPLSTMPPHILAALPKLPEDLEYRFVGLRLILLDTQADIILDYAEGVLVP